MKSTNIPLSPELHKAAKIEAAKRNLTLGNLLEEAIKNLLNKNKGKQ